MKKIIIAITSDHAGVELKSKLKGTLEEVATQVIDLGAYNTQSVDYPDYGNALAEAILNGTVHYGVALCGTGIGIGIALNRHKGIRAAVCHDGLSATLARLHNNANVLCMGARLIGEETAKDCVKRFFAAAFEGGRHEKRVNKLG
jgi:ribose 5-phosphate isomerase B